MAVYKLVQFLGSELLPEKYSLDYKIEEVLAKTLVFGVDQLFSFFHAKWNLLIIFRKLCTNIALRESYEFETSSKGAELVSEGHIQDERRAIKPFSMLIRTLLTCGVLPNNMYFARPGFLC